ncbi:putative dehydrogenase [Paraphysoderma sedebokerense]|nr:putative dehydrogenase [Paraphysoderma sedebokerense]
MAQQFDFIIAGGGTAGCVLASRLAEDKDVSILVLEAGKSDAYDLRSKIPPLFTTIFENSGDWAIKTAPQKNLHDRVLLWPRGKMLGGCSSINAQMYLRGSNEIYDDWAKEVNDPSWAGSEVAKYNLKSTRSTISDAYGKDGPWPVTFPPYTNPATYRFLDACKELGFAYNPDLNGEKNCGAGPCPTFTERGMRSSTAQAYLRDGKQRPNVTILTEAFITKLVIEVAKDGTKKATGVEYKHDGMTLVASAKREVLLCAGAIHSPHILMLSGVGEKAQLEKVGIECIHNLPGVGKNLQDHIQVPLTNEITVADSEDDVLRKDIWSIPYLIRSLFAYIWNQGPLTSMGSPGVAFFNTKDFKSQAMRPNFEFIGFPLMAKNHGRDTLPGYFNTIMCILLSPFSKGQLTLKSSNPEDQPIVDPNYFSDPRDMKAMVDGFNLARKVVAQPSYKKVVKKEVVPGEDMDVIEHIRNSAETLYHPVGTCKMGKKNDKTAVVDSQLKVIGINALRIIDASIMPNIMEAHTCAPGNLTFTPHSHHFFSSNR